MPSRKEAQYKIMCKAYKLYVARVLFSQQNIKFCQLFLKKFFLMNITRFQTIFPVIQGLKIDIVY